MGQHRPGEMMIYASGGNAASGLAIPPAEPRNLTSINTRFDRAREHAASLIERLSLLADRIDPVPENHMAGQGGPSPVPSGLVPQAHEHHDMLSRQFERISEYVGRIEKAVG